MPRKALKRRPDGRYACRYKEQWFYGKTSEEALTARDDYRYKERAGELDDSLGMRIVDYAPRWLKTTKSQVGVRTYNDYAHYLNVLCGQFPGARLKEITSLNIRELYNTQIGKSASHIKKFCMIINDMFSSALDDELIQRNPCAKVKRPDGKDGTHRPLEKWERNLIINMSGKHPFGAAAMLMLYGGLRRGEALTFDIDRDCNFETRIIYVRESVEFVHNQANVKNPKSEAGVREIPLFEPLYKALEGRHGLAVQSRKSGSRLSESAFASMWSSYKSALEKQVNGCGRRWYGKRRSDKQILASGEDLPPYKEITIRTHDFRHSFCTMLYDANVDIKTAMKWMGHADEKMILRIYAHLSAEKEKEAARKVGKLLNEALCSQNGSQSREDTL